MSSIDNAVRPTGLNVNVAGIQDYAVRQAMLQLMRAVVQLQDQIMGARKVEEDGMPANGQVCEVIGGIYLRIVSKGFSELLHRVEHKLDRVPQGCIFVRQQSGLNECVIEGDRDRGILKADNREVTFSIADNAGQPVIALIF